MGWIERGVKHSPLALMTGDALPLQARLHRCSGTKRGQTHRPFVHPFTGGRHSLFWSIEHGKHHLAP